MSHHHSPEYRQALKVRLHRIIGQLHGLERMLDEDRDCPEILNQVVSARRALKAFAEAVIAEHLRHCIEGAETGEEARRKVRELLLVLERYVA